MVVGGVNNDAVCPLEVALDCAVTVVTWGVTTAGVVDTGGNSAISWRATKENNTNLSIDPNKTVTGRTSRPGDNTVKRGYHIAQPIK